MGAAEPFFCAVLRGITQWTVEANWPDDSTETFADYLKRWLSARSTAWINQRMTVGEVG
jgi:hypothetical protein